MNLNLFNISLLVDHKLVGLVISLVVIVISVSAICFKYYITHNKDKDK